MKTRSIILFLFLTLFHQIVLADRPISEALASAKVEISASNATAVLCFAAVTESSFLSGLEYAIQDYEDMILVEAEKQKVDAKEYDKQWFETYRPIYQQILRTKKLPENAKISEMKHIVPISKNSPNKMYCDENNKYRRGLDLRLDIRKVSDTALGFSMPLLNIELGGFSRK
jgi:hypothetical protein